ncbi:MAG: AI-2E family transporter, partial [Firmicutes bacterium]|nr:AI-2E family transporter [Bacillota bacterium]
MSRGQGLKVQQSLVWGVGVVVLVLMAYKVRGAFVPFIVAAFIAYVINPLVRMAEARGAPRVAAIFTAYVLVMGGIAFGLAFVLPALAGQFEEIAREAPEQS